MKTLFRIVIRLCLVLILGGILTLWVAQNNTRVQRACASELFKFLKKKWKADIHVDTYRLNFFTGSLFIEKGVITSRVHHDCWWQFDDAKIKVDLLRLILKKEAALRCTFNNVFVNTDYHERASNKIDITEHIGYIFESVPKRIKVIPELIRLNDIKLHAHNTQGDKKLLTCCLNGVLEAQKKYASTGCDYSWKVNLLLDDGDVAYDKSTILTKLFGSVAFVSHSNSDSWEIVCDNTCVYKDNQLFLKINWGQDKKKILLCDNTRSCDIDISSDCVKKLLANLSVLLGPSMSFDGAGTWDKHDKMGTIVLKNRECIKYSNWEIKSEDAIFKIIAQSQGQLSGTYAITLVQHETQKKVILRGTFVANTQEVTLMGTAPDVLENGAYRITVSLSPEPHVSKFYCTIGKDKVISLRTKDKNKKILAGTVAYSFIQALLPQSLKYAVLGRRALFYVALDQKDFNILTGSIALKRGKFYIPEVRNLVEKFRTNFTVTMRDKKVVFSDAYMGLSRGYIKALRAFFTHDTFHVPLEINNLFLNWKKDFYGFVYGDLLVHKRNNKQAHVSGNLILKKSLLKENIFSREANNNLYSSDKYNLTYDIHVRTQKPMAVKTASLKTSAHVDIMLATPYISGALDLDGGFIKFLRNKLFIEYGTVQFLPNKLDDPLIDLLAKNTINKYAVTLQATGSLQKPNILLEADPELKEEQVLGLLLAGSEHATLQADLPIMLMQNLHDIILGSKKMLPKTTTFFEKITRALQYVQITPNFTDQTGRGGIKGVISIDLNKQLHAQIQKNFNLQDDLAFQVEYLVSDDINVKVVKDQRGELGSELEVRFKL